MDINWIRSFFTVLIFVSFMLVIYIVYSRRNKQNYDEAANSIFDDKEDKPDENGR